METLFEEGIIAFVPRYVDSRGNCTIVYSSKSDPTIVDKSIKTLIRLLGKYYMMDLKEVKKNYASLLPSANLMPIAISKEDVYIPFKARVPMYKNDGAFGYINIRYIKDIKAKEGFTLLLLNNGLEFKCLSSLATMEKHWRNGKIISRCYEDRSIKPNESLGIYDSFIPASKADIHMIKEKLQEICKRY